MLSCHPHSSIQMEKPPQLAALIVRLTKGIRGPVAFAHMKRASWSQETSGLLQFLQSLGPLLFDFRGFGPTICWHASDAASNSTPGGRRTLTVATNGISQEAQKASTKQHAKQGQNIPKSNSCDSGDVFVRFFWFSTLTLPCSRSAQFRSLGCSRQISSTDVNVSRCQSLLFCCQKSSQAHSP